MVTKVKA